MTVSVGTRLGPYEVVAPLGAGGMGEVYRARDTRLAREVAIKVLPADVASDASRLKRFEKEARAASALNHPNIVTVLDLGQTEGTSWIAMELVAGATLRQLLAEGALPIKKLLAISAQVAEGLAKAHEAGIVHRDLKPENVMVTRDGFAKILDFGLAKLTQAESDSDKPTQAPTVSAGTEPGIVVGTVAYMSPEQALGKGVDYRSDQFSFGSMLYEMAAGKKTFARASGPETMAAIIREEPTPLSAVSPGTPVPLRWIVERCLAKDPDERYASTRDLARDLVRLREGISETTGAGVLAAAPTRRSLSWLAPAALALAAGVAIGVLATRKGPPPVADYHAVTFRRGTIGRARFAPDGQTIVYGAQWDGRLIPELFSTRVDSTESRYLGVEADVSSISSTGRMAVALFGHGETLAEMSLAGGSPREIVDDSIRGDWAPDDRGLAVIRNNKLEFPVGKVFGSAGEANHLVGLRFSPDGKQIAAVENLRGSGESSSLAVFDVASGKKRTLSTGWGFAAQSLAWHPRTREIWFSPRDVEPGSVLMVCAVDPSTGSSRVVARPPGVTVVQDIAPDGRVLMKVDDWHESVMYGHFGSQETNFSWLDFSRVAALSDDGKTLLLEEGGRGGGAKGSIYVRKSDGSPATRLGDGRPLALSPDSKWVIAVPGTTLDRLLLLPTGAGQSREFKTEGMKYAMAVWMPDGRGFLFAALAGDKPRTYLQDVSVQTARPLGPEGFVLGGPVSPDGKTAILARTGVPAGAGGPRWFFFPIEGGGEPRPIPGVGKDVGDVLRWDASGRSLYISKGALPAEIWRLDIASGRQEKVGVIGPSDTTGTEELDTVLLTPDGKTYAYSFQRRLSTLFVVTGLR
jgi:hypothetical protein